MIPVLIVDSSPEFCILIRQTLEETGNYQVTQATSGAEAVEIAQGGDLDLAIVDFRLADISGPHLVRALRSHLPDLAIIAIPLSQDAEDLEELGVNGMLTKPFYLPDLPEIVAAALELQPYSEAAPAPPPRPDRNENPPEHPAEPPPPWLADVDRAARYLTRLTLESSAEAAMLTRGRRLWAYAGQLPRGQVQELTGVIADYWARDGSRGALAKFVRLPGSSDDLMLYATSLPGEIVLSLVFDSETPFGNIRREAHDLAHALSEVDPADASPDLEDALELGEAEETLAFPSDWIPEDESNLAELPFLSGLAELDLPPPDPETAFETGSAVEPAIETSVEEAAGEVPIPRDWVPETARPASHLPFLDEPSLEETRPQATRLPEPMDAEVSDELTYTFVLVPRFPEHRLAGELAGQVADWVERICLAWDWRAKALKLHENYLLVTLTLLPEVAPAQAVRQLREDLSVRILEAYPELAADLPSGRFWARGYLLASGKAPEAARIETFIERTRRSQGIAS